MIVDISVMLENERTHFLNGWKTEPYERYKEVIEILANLVREKLIDENEIIQERDANPKWFDLKVKKYISDKNDNIKYSRFPEPLFFISDNYYFEYNQSSILIDIPSTHPNYALLLALHIRHSLTEEIPNILDTERMEFHDDFYAYCYRALIDQYHFLFSAEKFTLVGAWQNNSPNTLASTLISMTYTKERELLREYLIIEEKIDHTLKNPLPQKLEVFIERKQKIKTLLVDTSLSSPNQIETKKAKYSVEMRSTFLTEWNFGRWIKYSKKQQKYLDQLISVVKNYLIKNSFVFQRNDRNSDQFALKKEKWKKLVSARKKRGHFPEIAYFFSDKRMYHYFDRYSYNFTQNDNPTYRIFFAFRLRQMLLEDINNFLEERQKTFNGDFIFFLQFIIIEFRSLFSKPTKITIKKWIKKTSFQAQDEFQNEEKKVVETSKEKIPNNNVSFLEMDFLTPPKNYIQIECKLKDYQIKKFLSFLYIETNGSKDGLPFLSEETVKQIFRYGLAYPNQEPKEKPYHLNLNGRKTKGILGYLFHFLYQSNKPLFPSKDYKSHYAKLLKNSFDNYTESEGTVKNTIRSREQARMDKKKFIISKYIDFDSMIK